MPPTSASLESAKRIVSQSHTALALPIGTLFKQTGQPQSQRMFYHFNFTNSSLTYYRSVILSELAIESCVKLEATTASWLTMYGIRTYVGKSWAHYYTLTMFNIVSKHYFCQGFFGCELRQLRVCPIQVQHPNTKA